MSASEGQEMKYSYRFRLEARKLGSAQDEPNKAEVQSYINEILGVSGNRDRKTSGASV